MGWSYVVMQFTVLLGCGFLFCVCFSGPFSAFLVSAVAYRSLLHVVLVINARATRLFSEGMKPMTAQVQRAQTFARV